jgi:hypothetical protein
MGHLRSISQLSRNLRFGPLSRASYAFPRVLDGQVPLSLQLSGADPFEILLAHPVMTPSAKRQQPWPLKHPAELPGVRETCLLANSAYERRLVQTAIWGTVTLLSR